MTDFWSISYPLGCVAKSLKEGRILEAIRGIEDVIKSYSDTVASWEKSDAKYLDGLFKFQVYLTHRQGVVFPTPECVYLWVAHMSARELHGGKVLGYHVLNKLLMELKDERVLQRKHIV